MSHPNGMLAEVVSEVREREDRMLDRTPAQPRRTDMDHPQLGRFKSYEQNQINRTMLSNLMYALDGLTTYERLCITGYLLYLNSDNWTVTPWKGVVSIDVDRVVQLDMTNDHFTSYMSLNDLGCGVADARFYL